LIKFYKGLRFNYEEKNKYNCCEEHKAILKFPFYSAEFRRNRNTDLDLEEIAQLLPTFENLCGFSIKPTDLKHLYDVHLTEYQKRIIALEGPGSKRHLDPENKRIRKEMQSSFVMDFDMSFDEVSIFLSSSQTFQKPYLDMNSFEENNLMCRYLELMELISREICQNANRQGRRRLFTITPTDVTGVYLMLYPGPPLRASQTNSTIWYKLISNSKIMFPKLTQRHWWVGEWNQTRWLSITAKKLDHYIRSKDQVLMAYYSHLSLEGPVEQILLKDTSDTLSLMTAIWSEDSRQTSSTLHDFRYFIMQKLSINPNFSKLKKKLFIPVRSPILYICIKRLLEFLLTSVRIEDLDKLTDENIETMGATISCQRVLTKGDNINFHQLINEMYFSMLFNKNEQEPYTDSLQILDKILESERDFIQSRTLGLVDVQGFDEEKLLEMMSTDHPGSYSADAIKIGVKLQLKSIHNNMGLSAPIIASEKRNINKNLESFATLKSSAIMYSDNERSKCLLEIIKLLDMKYEDAFEIASHFLDKEIEVQLFKKNQFGGIREISILDIVSRIKVNIVETYFRNMCYFDDREMLTKGSRKYDIMRDNNKKTFGKTKFYFNGDATRWAQSFHTHQFKYLIGCHDTPLKGYAQRIFQQFTEKKLYPPKTLTDLWIKYADEDKGNNSLLNDQKRKYLSGEVSIKNESNMCQGILHYTSSYLHCCLMSFIELIMARISTKLRLNLTMTAQVSSDDYLITLMTEIRQSKNLIRGLSDDEGKRLIERVKKLNFIYFFSQHIIKCCQRLFNVHDSAKTSLTSNVYEFNSCFALKFTFLSPIIKFSIASTEPINTDSPSRMVTEGINRVNQMIDNGAQIDLVKIAHRFNSKYVEEITGLVRKDLPVEVGVYPHHDLAVELYMFGYKYHNFCLLRNYDNLPYDSKCIISSCLINQFADPVEMAANLLYDDVKQHGKIRLTTAPSKKWKKLVSQLPYSYETLTHLIEQDPMIPIKTSPTYLEQLIRCSLKAFTSNVRDSLRNTSPSIYYARYSAYRTASAFAINSDEQPKTFQEVLQSLVINCLPVEVLNKRYPDYQDMLIIYGMDKIQVSSIQFKRPKFQSKRYNRLRMISAVDHIKTNIIQLLNYKWLSIEPNPREIGQYERDWTLMTIRHPFFKNGLENSLIEIRRQTGLDDRKSIAFLFKMINSNLKEISFERRAFTYGISTQNVIDTFRLLQYENYFSDRRMKTFEDNVKNIPVIELLPTLSIYDFFMRFSNLENFKNFISVVKIAGKTIMDHLLLDYEAIYYSFDGSINRRKFIIMLIHLKILEEEQLIRLLSDQRIVMRQWLLEQKQTDSGDWIGNMGVIYFSRDSALNVKYNSNEDMYSFKMKKGVKWTEDIGLCIKQFLTDFKLSFDILQKHCINGEYSYNVNPATIYQATGIRIIVDPTLSYVFSEMFVEVDNSNHIVTLKDNRGTLIRSLMTIDPVHMNYEIPDIDVKIYVNGFNIYELSKYHFLLETFNILNTKIDIANFDRNSIKGIVKPTELVSRLLNKLHYEFKELEDPTFEITEEKGKMIDPDYDSWFTSLINPTEDDLKGIIDPEIFNQDLDRMKEDFKSEPNNIYDAMGFSDDMIKELMKIINPELPIDTKLFHFRDIQRIEQMPYVFYKEKIYNKELSEMELISILTYRNYDSDWQLQFVIYLANQKIKSSNIRGQPSPHIRFEEPIDITTEGEYTF
jgi:hypothetical protein